MRSQPILLAILSCCGTAEATTSTNSQNSRSSAIHLATRRSFVPKPSRSSSTSSSSWNLIPRGGSDTNGDSSSTSSPPDMSSLLSGMNNIPGMPDLSSPPDPAQIAQSMEQFTSLLSSPQFKEMLNDPEKLNEQLETMRQSLLGALEEMEKGDNPMMAMMMEQMKQQLAASFPGGWDGLKDMIQDAEKWKEMMGGLVEVMKSLGEEDLNAIMNQMGWFEGYD
eukprot:CAMPEP_0183722476 /NCGR_PEP_ID=MMETSP0737-20130205/14417_1 /TAXON_ID=385413 /ORGANISM="Thalassiosira miniscula, Strain CCMP1093" /LENGTH=221 /DNA_ID=CAMNT_0025952637 /DNA_START=63 /DNA_END=725 /DNA_ORIENTATION=-